MVKTKLCDFERILLIVFHLPYRPVSIVVVNNERIDDGDKDAVLVKSKGNRFMVTACTQKQRKKRYEPER